MVDKLNQATALLNDEISPERNTKGIKLLTYNFFQRPPPIHTGGDDYKEVRLQYFTKEYIGNFDIINFQESFCMWNDRKHELIEKAREVGLKYHATSKLHDYYFNGKIWDGGLLSVSRYPMLNIDQHHFQTPGALEDDMCGKGVLYTKIDLSSVGGKAAHLFNLHLQASYFNRTVDGYVDSVVARYEQCKEVRSFVERKVFDDKTNYDKDNDIVILMGDFNINALEISKYALIKLNLAEKEDRFKPVLPLLKNEYKFLTKVISSSKYRYIDLSRQSLGNGKSNPITFADSVVDENGNEKPVVPEFYDEEDCMSKQALDYMFLLIPTEAGSTQGKQELGDQSTEIKSGKLNVSIMKT